MQCETCREYLSARLDGEPADPSVDEHLAGCPPCRAWLVEATGLDDRVAPALSLDAPDRAAAILAAVGADRAEAQREETAALLFPWRAGLAAVGLLQLLLAVPALLGTTNGVTEHLSREMGSFDVALGVGFVFAAWRPARAWGMLPLVATLAACLVVTTLVDLQQGQAGALAESTHLLDLIGLGLLWALAYSYRRPAPARARLVTP
jgi:predicted anti-sigma-YlaC factor YlaD